MIPKLIVFAHIEEARPFINHFVCKHLGQFKGIQCLFSEHENTYILVTGGGSLATTVGITSFFEKYIQPNTDVVCFNVGIAGSFALPLYHVFYASRVTNYHTQKSFYPDVFIKTNYAELMSIEFPADETILRVYPSSMFDMEAYAFVHAARYYVKNHFIHCIKFISDNNGVISDMFQLLEKYQTSTEQILQLIHRIYDNIIAKDDLKTVTLPINQELLDALIKEYRLTHSQRQALHKALKYYSIHHLSEQINELLKSFLDIKIQHKQERNKMFNKILNALYNV